MAEEEQQERLNQEFLQCRHSLIAYINELTSNSVASEDIFQEVWLRLNRAVQEGKSIANCPAWCRVVAKNLIIDSWRHEQSVNVVYDSELLELVDKAFEEAAKEVSK